MRASLAAAFLFAIGVVFMSETAPAAPAIPASEPAPQQEKLPPPPPAEKLAAIKAPAIKPVQQTKLGYRVTVDPTQQILSLHAPKQENWISREVEAQQTLEVVVDGAPISSGATALARARKGQLLYASVAEKEWIDVHVVKDGKLIRGWIAKKHVKPVAEANPPQPRLRPDAEFASAALLIQKAKQFDDGLYAAVEFAMQNGLGPVKGKRHWIPAVAAKVDAGSGGEPLAILYAAMQFSGHKSQLPAELARLRDAHTQEFLADEKRSKPLGFYTWSPELETIFQQDRMLQTPLNAQSNSPAIIAVARALAADVEARNSYETALQLNARLTNKLAKDGYQKTLAALAAGQTPQFGPRDAVSFLPPSRSHETDLIMKLYGNRPIPEGFDLMTELIRRLKGGDLSLEPQEDSGWYDHQLYSLETLIRFDTAPEARKLQPNDEYRKHLEELFKGTYALTRETHVKQLEIPAPASAAPFDGPPVKEREKVFVRPSAHVEYLPTVYRRRADSYRFVRQVLAETFGAENIQQLKRQTATGPVELNLADELDLMEQLFRGAYVAACRDIGLPEDPATGAGDEQAIMFLRWVASLRSDRDLAIDSRMMVPVFYDQQRRKLKVWVMLGWDSTYTSIGYARHPGITITDKDGNPVSGDEGPEVIFQGTYCNLPTPVFAEVYVTKLLNRSEFRRHCDAYKSKAAILANLE